MEWRVEVRFVVFGGEPAPNGPFSTLLHRLEMYGALGSIDAEGWMIELTVPAVGATGAIIKAEILASSGALEVGLPQSEVIRIIAERTAAFGAISNPVGELGG